jgi:peroxiredoxin
MQKKIILAIVIAGISFSYLFLSGRGSCPFSALVNFAHAAPQSEHRVQPLAPAFSLPTLEGTPISLADYRGKVVVLNFWASWCPPCRAEMPSMDQLYRSMKDKDFTVLAVNVESGGKSAVSSFMKKIPLSFPVLLDDTQNVSELYQVSGLPQTFIINKHGEIVQRVTGGIDWNAPKTREYITSLLQGD